jgi:hypothetical protein
MPGANGSPQLEDAQHADGSEYEPVDGNGRAGGNGFTRHPQSSQPSLRQTEDPPGADF